MAEKVRYRWEEDPETGCWIWQLGSSGGRPKVYVDGVQQYAYRWVYEECVGPVPKGMHLHHVCGNPMCVHFDHLRVLSPSEHMSLHQVERWQVAA